jgi:hypothetical protein
VSALNAFPGGLHVGGGVTPENAGRYLDAGASHVIVTSYVFRNGRLEEDRLNALVGSPPTAGHMDRSGNSPDGVMYCCMAAAGAAVRWPATRAGTCLAHRLVQRLCPLINAVSLKVRAVGKHRLVLDLSCRKRKDTYYVVTGRCKSPLFCADGPAVIYTLFPPKVRELTLRARAQAHAPEVARR